MKIYYNGELLKSEPHVRGHKTRKRRKKQSNAATVLLLGIIIMSFAHAHVSLMEYFDNELEYIQPSVAHAHVEPVDHTKEAIMYEIAKCESGGVHKIDGEVIRGYIDNDDIGKYQINLRYHDARATEMGLDVFTESDNEEYASYLYDTQGTQPWNASKPCWGPKVALIQGK
jgi:hypothetical protein